MHYIGQTATLSNRNHLNTVDRIKSQNQPTKGTVANHLYRIRQKHFHAALLICSFCVAFDLHNAILLSALNLASKNELFLQLRPINDILFVLLTIALIPIARQPLRNGRATIPTLTILVLTYTGTLILDNSDLALIGYIRFIAGNVLCFIAAASTIHKREHLNHFGILLIVTSIILTGITLYLYTQGQIFGSTRDEFFPGTEVRTGYYCAFSTIYALTLPNSLKHTVVKSLAFSIGLLSAILTANNAALSIIIVASVAWPITAIKHQKTLTLLTLSIVPILIYLAYNHSQTPDSVFKIIKAQQSSASVRLTIGFQYISLASENLLTGNGIGSAYSLDFRTHSVTIAFLVQSGIIGACAYIALLGTSCIPLTKALINIRLEQKDAPLIIGMFLLLFALISQSELSGDIPNNRNCWYILGAISGFRYSLYNQSRIRLTRPNENIPIN